jgi:NCAIR mutase (PurE)-related protein
LKDLEDKGLISLKENYITTQEYDNHIPQRFGYPIAKTAPDGTRSYDMSEKEIKMKTSKERENIDDILAAIVISNKYETLNCTISTNNLIKRCARRRIHFSSL